jgi:hypothetical protein
VASLGISKGAIGQLASPADRIGAHCEVFYPSKDVKTRPVVSIRAFRPYVVKAGNAFVVTDGQ